MRGSRIRRAAAIGLFVFAVVGTAVPARAAKIWTLGGRVVPGPLPPDPFAKSPAVDLQSDVVYGTAGSVALKLDFAKPVLCRDQKVPLIVYIHGGGWTSGSKSGIMGTPLANLAFQLGFGLAAVDYRLAPGSRFPAQVNDCKLAVRYLRSRADDLGIDGERIAVTGASAGGHLASMLGTAGDSDGLEGPGLAGFSSRVSAVVDVCGPSDLTDIETGIGPEGAAFVLAFLGCLPRDCPVLARQASPASYVTAGDPPILIFHGEKDQLVPYHQAEILAEKMRLAGNGCALIRVKNADHEFSPDPPGSMISPGILSIARMTLAHLARYLEPALFGDLNMDGRRDFSDTILLLQSLGKRGVSPSALPAPESWNPMADLAPDGVIDARDVLAYVRIK